MIIAELPVNEAARIDALHSLRILDTPREERFDRLTRLARRLFDVRQWEAGEGDVRAFCA